MIMNLDADSGTESAGACIAKYVSHVACCVQLKLRADVC